VSPRDLRRILTERLSLEALGPEHAAELTPLLDDPQVARTLSPNGRPPVPGGSPEALGAKAVHWERFGFGLWLLRDRGDGTMVGRGGIQHALVEGHEEVELAWAIVPSRWREGLATELARACVEIASEDLELPSVVAFTLPDNLPSRAVMTKAGMSYERDIVHVGLPHVLYRRTR
jgi:ribosomal-protein-alanine N-acetyltransferase